MIWSWFKYVENVQDESVGIHRDDRYGDRQGLGAGSRFFSAPFLEVESITYSDMDVELGRSYNPDYSVQDPEKFDCRIWIIKIHSRNPAFIILNKCVAKAYITTGRGQSTSHAVKLPWKNLMDPPISLAPDTGLTRQTNVREQYKRIFAYYYEEELRRNYASVDVDIRKGVSNDLYFLLTFKDSPYAYLLTMSGSEISHGDRNVFYESIDGLPLALPINTQYTFDILFQGVNIANENQGGHVKILLDIKSWDKILLLSDGS